jgi:hypothetical protein
MLPSLLSGHLGAPVQTNEIGIMAHVVLNCGNTGDWMCPNAYVKITIDTDTFACKKWKPPESLALE